MAIGASVFFLARFSSSIFIDGAVHGLAIDGRERVDLERLITILRKSLWERA